MTLIELFYLVLIIVLTLTGGRYFYSHIGWWGVLPGAMLGLGLAVFLLAALGKLISRYGTTPRR